MCLSPPRALPPLPRDAQRAHDTAKTRSSTQRQIQHRAYSSVLTMSWMKNTAIKIILRPLPTSWAPVSTLEPSCPDRTHRLCQAGCGTGLLKSNFSSSEHFWVSGAGYTHMTSPGLPGKSDSFQAIPQCESVLINIFICLPLTSKLLLMRRWGILKFPRAKLTIPTRFALAELILYCPQGC